MDLSDLGDQLREHFDDKTAAREQVMAQLPRGDDGLSRRDHHQPAAPDRTSRARS